MLVAKQKKDSLEELKTEALRRQDNLAADIDELLDRVNPKNAVQRWKNEASDYAKGFFVAGDGSLKTAPVAGLAAGAIGIVALTVGLSVLASRTPRHGEYFDRSYDR